MPGRRAEPWRLPALCGKTHSQLDARLGAGKGALPHHGWQAGLTQASPRFVSRSLCWVHAQAGMVREEENLILVKTHLEKLILVKTHLTDGEQKS